MARFVFFLALATVAVGALWYVGARLRGRPFVNDTAGKVLVALTIAGVALWLFGGGALFE